MTILLATSRLSAIFTAIVYRLTDHRIEVTPTRVKWFWLGFGSVYTVPALASAVIISGGPLWLFAGLMY